MTTLNRTKTVVTLAAVAMATLALTATSANGALWTPDEITTIGWYDASDAANVVTSGTTVTNWKDLSGNGYDLTTRSGTPEFDGAPHINGRTAVRFAGTEQIYRAGIPSINLTEVTLISVGQGGPGGDWHNWGRAKSTDGTSFLHFRRRSGNPRMTATVNIAGAGGAFEFPNNASSYANDIPFMAAVFYDGDRAYLRGNGGADTADSDRTDSATFTINDIQAGRDSNTQGNYHGEMLILPTADLSTLQLVEGYLAWKWGTADKLPNDHPYKLAAPMLAAAVPEPTALALSLLALFSLSFVGWRRRRR